MAKTKNDRKKPAVKVSDLGAKNDPKGGRDASTGQATGRRSHAPVQIGTPVNSK